MKMDMGQFLPINCRCIITLDNQLRQENNVSSVNSEHQHLMAAVQENYTTIGVVFERNDGGFATTSQAYTYKTHLSDDVKVGDHVVVDSPHNGLTVVRVVAVHSVPRINPKVTYTYKWIVQKIDRTAYDDQMAREKAFLEEMRLIEERVQFREVVAKYDALLPIGTEGGGRLSDAIAVLKKFDA